MVSLRQPTPSLNAPPLLLFVLAAAAGAGTAVLASVPGTPPTFLLLVLAAGAVLVSLGPLPSAIAVGVLSVTGLVPGLISFGQINVRLDDVFYVVWAGWVLFLLWIAGPVSRPPDLGFGGLLAFFCYVALSSLGVGFVDPERFGVSFTSLLRLLQTGSMVWLIAQLVRARRDLQTVVHWVLIGCAAAVGIAMAEALKGGSLAAARFGGYLNENTLGLVSGFLVVAGLFPPTLRTPVVRALCVSAGMIGLLLSKSIGGITSTSLVVMVGGVWMMNRRGFRLSPLTAITVLFLALLPALAAVLMLRPELSITSEEFRGSSIYHRVIMGSAGVKTFLDHPVVGVGWQRGTSEEVIEDEEMARFIRHRFSDVNPHLFPDITPTNFHNAFIQILAELGLVGFVLFAIAVVHSGVAIRRVVSRTEGSAWWPLARFFALSALLVLIWWNDNPIFGGQTETVALAFWLGSLVVCSKFSGPSAGVQRTAGPPRSSSRNGFSLKNA